MKLNFSFSLRGPDRVAEELATVLSKEGSLEFKSLFDIVHTNLRSRDLARGGEEMLRLRAYEKLQNLVQAGIVKKAGKEYRGVPKALVAFFQTAAEFNARFASGKHCRPPFAAGEAQKPALAVKKAEKAPVASLVSKRSGVKPAKDKPAVRKAVKGLGKGAPKGRKAAAKAR
jgi:hypothetical protein